MSRVSGLLLSMMVSLLATGPGCATNRYVALGRQYESANDPERAAAAYRLAVADKAVSESKQKDYRKDWERAARAFLERQRPGWSALVRAGQVRRSNARGTKVYGRDNFGPFSWWARARVEPHEGRDPGGGRGGVAREGGAWRRAAGQNSHGGDGGLHFE